MGEPVGEPTEEWEHFVAGCAAGATEVLFAHPIDTVKVRLQSRTYGGLHSAATPYTLRRNHLRTLFQGSTQLQPFAGWKGSREDWFGCTWLDSRLLCILRALFALVKWSQGSLQRLDVGCCLGRCGLEASRVCTYAKAHPLLGPLSSSLSVALPTHYLSGFKRAFGANDSNPYSAGYVGAAAATGLVETIVYCPFEVAKTQLQVGHKPASLYRSAGPAGLYMGFMPLLGSHIVGNVAFFVVYGAVQQYCADSMARKQDGAWNQALSTTVAGGVAGALYYLAGHPFDTVQSCIMSQRYPGERYTSAVNCTLSLLHDGGWRSLFRGVLPNVLQAIPGGAAQMLAFEAVLTALCSRREETSVD